MVNVKDKHCIHDGCKTIPIFNKEGSKSALYCAAHKKDGMMDIRNKRCIHEGCNKQPVFNVDGAKTALFCAVHKEDGMVDIKSKRCIHDGCNTRPTFNVEGSTEALYCALHKKDGMVDIKHKHCIHEGCKTQSVFNVEGSKIALFCAAHKTDCMVDVKNKKCKTHLCSTRVQEKYDGYCLFCYMHLFPDKPVSRNYKTKEYSVVEHVKTKFPDLPWVADRIVNGGCSRRRPDLLLDLLYQVVIIEIDENQHTDYDCSCQNKRIMELSQDVGHRPIVFIRFNPDDYKKDGTNITSCWGQDKNGICVVKKSKKSEWTQRLNTLEEHINYWIAPENTTDKTIEIIQLYYDV